MVKADNFITYSGVGPFVRGQRTKELCFLTARGTFGTGIRTRLFLPPDFPSIQKKHICGKVIAAIHEGNDIVLVKIANEILSTWDKFTIVPEGDLARAGISNPDLPSYEMGDILDARKLTIETGARSMIVVFCGGRLLTGRLELDGSRVRTQDVELDVTLKDVLLVRLDIPRPLSIPLYWSGSAVYLLDNNTRLRCIGMMYGEMADNIDIVLPIQDVLEELGHKIGQTLEIETFQIRTSTHFQDDELSLVAEYVTPKTSDCLPKIGLLHAVDDTEMSKGLGNKGLLDSIGLKKLCSGEGRTSSNVEKECNKICAAIKAESDQIVHVLPAYKLNDEATIVFVVFAERQITFLLPWTLEVRIVHQYSDESRIAMYCKENSPLSMETAKTIGDIIDKYSVELMRNHTYLSAISASSVVSKQYGTTNHSIVPGPCIVLSVLVKHFIPINEEPFPTLLEEIPVDVREGGVRLCGGSAYDFYDHVRMGCKITSSLLPDKFGTLGGFVEHPEYGLCGFTCAHAILTDELKNELKDKVNVKGKQLCEMFQPSSAPENKIGRVVELTYVEGNGGKTGVDLALFKIEQRPPTEGNFPDNEGTTTIKFESGRVWGKEGIPIHPPLVQKFGCVTGLTYGQIQFDGAVVKEIKFHSKMETNTLSLTTTLYKQYHIKSNDINLKFSDLGDSGALVFMSDDFDKENDLRCIGMVEGIWDDHTSCAVTPITAILEELKVTQLKSFAPIITWKRIDARFREMEERMKGMEERVMKAITKGNTNVQNTSE